MHSIFLVLVGIDVIWDSLCDLSITNAKAVRGIEAVSAGLESVHGFDGCPRRIWPQDVIVALQAAAYACSQGCMDLARSCVALWTVGDHTMY